MKEYSEEEKKEIRMRWNSIEEDLDKYLSPDGKLLNNKVGIIENTLIFVMSESSSVIFNENEK